MAGRVRAEDESIGTNVRSTDRQDTEWRAGDKRGVGTGMVGDKSELAGMVWLVIKAILLVIKAILLVTSVPGPSATSIALSSLLVFAGTVVPVALLLVVAVSRVALVALSKSLGVP